MHSTAVQYVLNDTPPSPQRHRRVFLIRNNSCNRINHRQAGTYAVGGALLDVSDACSECAFVVPSHCCMNEWMQHLGGGCIPGWMVALVQLGVLYHVHRLRQGLLNEGIFISVQQKNQQYRTCMVIPTERHGTGITWKLTARM